MDNITYIAPGRITSPEFNSDIHYGYRQGNQIKFAILDDIYEDCQTMDEFVTYVCSIPQNADRDPELVKELMIIVCINLGTNPIKDMGDKIRQRFWLRYSRDQVMKWEINKVAAFFAICSNIKK